MAIRDIKKDTAITKGTPLLLAINKNNQKEYKKLSERVEG
jgi:hypothetical protein